jgi:hypothetical protein
MEYPNLSQGKLVADEVNVDLDVVCATMVDMISSHIDNANIVAVAVHDGGRGNRRTKLLDELTKSTTLDYDMSNRAVLNLSTRTGHRRLALGGPRDQIVAEEDVVAGCRALGIWTTCPVRVGVCGERVNQPRAEVEVDGQSALHVAEDALDQREIRLARKVHEEAHLLDHVGELRTGECQVM